MVNGSTRNSRGRFRNSGQQISGMPQSLDQGGQPRDYRYARKCFYRIANATASVACDVSTNGELHILDLRRLEDYVH